MIKIRVINSVNIYNYLRERDYNEEYELEKVIS